MSLGAVVFTAGATRSIFGVEWAKSAAERTRGLMCRSRATPMLFEFEEERTGGFWMFNTYVPLDILYFGGDSGDAAFRQMTPCPRDEGEATMLWRSRCVAESVSYDPEISYRFALEFPEGWLESQGFDVSNPSDIEVSFLVTP